MRRLLLLGSAVVFIDVAFFEAIIPLLPGYADDLGLSKASAGILTAAYAAGTLAASLPAGLMAARFGPRRTLLLGLGMLGAASLAFGFGANIVVLDAARFVQGVAGALAWSGALSWLILAAPGGAPRRGDRRRARRGRRGRAARPGARRAGARDRDRAGLRVHARRHGWPRDRRPTLARASAGRAPDDPRGRRARFSARASCAPPGTSPRRRRCSARWRCSCRCGSTSSAAAPASSPRGSSPARRSRP